MTSFKEILEKAKEKNKKSGKIPTLALIYPYEKEIKAAEIAQQEGLIKPILIVKEDIFKLDSSVFKEIKKVNSHEHALNEAKILSKNVSILMNGTLSIQLFLENIIEDKKKVRILSHVAVFEIKAYKKLLLISDAELHTEPDLANKIDIVNNAANAAKFLDIQIPKISIASAVETIAPQMISACDGAILSKMAERGQFKNMLIDGPLSMDASISEKAAHHKGITTSKVAGDADILIVNNIEVGKSLCAALSLFTENTKAAHIIAGYKIPIIPTTTYGSIEDKVNSIALAVLMSQ